MCGEQSKRLEKRSNTLGKRGGAAGGVRCRRDWVAVRPFRDPFRRGGQSAVHMLCIRVRRGARGGCCGGVLSTSTTVVWVLSRSADIVPRLFFYAVRGLWFVAEVVQVDGLEIAGGCNRFGGGVRGVLYPFRRPADSVVLQLYAKSGADVFQSLYPFFNRADGLRLRIGGDAVSAFDKSVIFCKKSVRNYTIRYCNFFVNLLQ